MDLFFRIFVWVCFAGLILYTFLYGRNEEKMDKKVFLIRKIWYLLYAFGAVVYWTKHPASVFTDWKNYLIVVAVFICVDALIFLNLYLRKAGNYEMERLTNTVSENGKFIDENLSMGRNMLHLLNYEGIMGYYDNEEDYLYGLNELLCSYASKEDMTVSILPYSTEVDKRQALASYNKTGSIMAKLDRQETVYNVEEKYALHPINLFDGKKFLLKILGKRDITEMDCMLFVILIYIYDYNKPISDVGGELS